MKNDATHDHDAKTQLHDVVDSMDEMATSISYYVIYTSDINKKQSTDNIDNNETSATDQDVELSTNKNEQIQQDADDLEQQHGFWQDDEWTSHDFQHAESLLIKTKELCNISSGRFPRANKNHTKHTTNAGSHKSWDRFYKNHGTKFFNDRHYLSKDYPIEFPEHDDSIKVVAEIGSGVGNTVLPLLEQYRNWTVWGFDYSATAIDLLKQDERYVEAAALEPSRAHAHVWDITTPPPLCISSQSADLCLLLFCLSAIVPQEMIAAAKHVSSLLKPGCGTLVFRDYGRYDQAQLQLGASRGKGLGDHWYVKHDGTRCYYFDLDDLKRIFVEGAGLELLELKYIRRVYRNRANGNFEELRRRVWVQGRFRKPAR